MHKELRKIFASCDTIVFVGGGTGGHISPIVALYKELKDAGKKIIWIGGIDSEEEKEAKKLGIRFEGIPVLKLSTTHSVKVLLYPFFSFLGIFQAKKILKKIKKESSKMLIFSKGGPGAVSIGIAGNSLKISLYIHESDTVPGRSNKQLARFAKKIFLGFESATRFFSNKDCFAIGQILDKELENDTSDGKITWKTQKKHILVLCGSQGARSVFEEITKNCKNLDVEWIVVLGKLNTNMRKDFEKMQNIQILDWLEKIDQNTVFRNTDIAITRGSATTLAELEMFHIQKIIIPLPLSAENHQFYNAKEYEKSGDVLLEQKNIQQLEAIIKSIL